jgi:DNA-binding GntR family transcriptional regulator
MVGDVVGVALLKVVPAPTLREKIADSIREAITEGSLLPGQRLVERELCEMTGASRSSIREALTQLLSEELVVSVPNRGFVVAVLSLPEAQSLYEVRAELESLAARQFAERASDDDVRRLSAVVTDLSALYDEADADPFIQARDQFMEVLLAGARNRVLQAMIDQIYSRLRRLRCASASSIARRRELIGEFQQLYGALEARDGEQAARLSADRVRRSFEVAMPQIEMQTVSEEFEAAKAAHMVGVG